MKLIAALLLAGFPAMAGAGTVFKWVDARGVVTYGNAPPAGAKAQALEVEGRRGPAATVPTPSPRAALSPAVAAVRYAPVGSPPGRQAAPPVRGMAFDTFMRLSRGMTEGELVWRAGRPDHLTVTEFARLPVTAYHYFPTASDPFVTTVTLRGGLIYQLERTRQF